VSNYQNLLDDLALLIGGTAPDLANRPGFYSGFEVGDGTGVATLHGCYSQPPESIDDLPIAIVKSFPISFTVRRGNPEANVDTIPLQILVSRDDVPSESPTLVNFRDTVEAAFRAHLTIATVAGAVNLTPAVSEALPTSGKSGVTKYNGVDYLGWDMMITVKRDPFGAGYPGTA
jgi:hypothetical protein